MANAVGGSTCELSDNCDVYSAHLYFQIPGNPNITGCISVPQWDNHKGSQPHDPTFKAAIDLHLPADTDAVTLQSFGTLSSGVVYISADPEWDLPAISFQVVASHTSQRILEEVFVCRRVENGHHTVSIHVRILCNMISTCSYRSTQAPSYAEGHEGAEPVDFTSALTFPSVSAIKNVFPDVSTDMPSFEHVIRTVSGKVRFGHISLNTSDQPVTVDVRRTFPISSPRLCRVTDTPLWAPAARRGADRYHDE